MKRFLQLAFLLAAFVSGAAHATLYNFSYTFNNGIAITGSLTGTQSGAYVTGLSNISVFHDGIAFNGNGSLQAITYDTVTGGFDAGTPVSVSADAALNNFFFIDVPLASISSYTNYFALAHHAGLPGGSAAELNLRPGVWDDAPINGTWTLTAAGGGGDLPEPGSLALLALALGVLGFKRRARKA